MNPGWLKPTPSSIPCEAAYAVFIPLSVIEGNTLGSLATSTNRVTKHYAMVASVFFKFIKTLTVPLELKCESVIEDGEVSGFRYMAIVTGQQNANYDPDKLVRDEIVLFFENEGKNQKKKFAKDEKDFAYMWRTMGEKVIGLPLWKTYFLIRTLNTTLITLLRSVFHWLRLGVMRVTNNGGRLPFRMLRR